jgi:TetR/AcrR family transcriptional repressor of bet genes
VSRRHPRTASAPAAPRASRTRQRQRLIDACISALHVHGPSKTTVEKVVAIARMSPGIVRFYFESKDAMLVASLEFLAAEFEERLLVPVAALRARPVEALERLVELYLGAELASTRKVSVWYSFWGEASSRQEYYDICGARDAKFEALVTDLVRHLIEETGARHLDADAIALGLIGVLEMLWQGFAFQTESTIDRPAAVRRALAYLRSVFPGSFVRDAGPLPATLPAGAYTNPVLQEAERQSLLRPAWQFVGFGWELEAPGDFLTLDGPIERVLVLRDEAGFLRALRNRCRQRPHALATGRSGHFDGEIACPVHGLRYTLAGAPAGTTPGGRLTALEVAVAAGLVFVRPAVPPLAAAAVPAGTVIGAAGARPLGRPTLRECEVAADWKVLVEQWLERLGGTVAAGAETGWSARRFATLVAREGSAAAPQAEFVGPNQLIEVGPGGVLVLQALPAGPGRARLRELRYPPAAPSRAGRAIAFLANRLVTRRLADERGLAESVQRGLESAGDEAEPAARMPAALAAFRQSIARLLPGDPHDSGDFA